MSVSDLKLNAENIDPTYSGVVSPDGELINLCAKDAEFSSMCDCPEKYIKIPKVFMCVKVLQWVSWCICY